MSRLKWLAVLFILLPSLCLATSKFDDVTATASAKFDGGTITKFDGITYTAAAASDTSMYITTGSYTGNATDNRAITVGFQPALVMIWSSSGHYGTLAMSSMTAGNSYEMKGGGGPYTDAIKSLDSTTFTLGTNALVNVNNDTYRWVAFAKNSDSDFYCGSYAGTGSAANITAPNFQPDFVIVVRAGTDSVIRLSSQSGDHSFLADSDETAGLITGFISTGFSVGTSGYINGGGVTYYYCAIKAGTNSKVSSYTGNGSDDRNITGVGWTPTWVILKNSVTYQWMGKNTTTAATDTAEYFLNNSSSVTNVIQNLNSDGFQVGSTGNANANGATYYYFTVKNHTP